jgi:hypothetical protein
MWSGETGGENEYSDLNYRTVSWLHLRSAQSASQPFSRLFHCSTADVQYSNVQVFYFIVLREVYTHRIYFREFHFCRHISNWRVNGWMIRDGSPHRPDSRSG